MSGYLRLQPALRRADDTLHASAGTAGGAADIVLSEGALPPDPPVLDWAAILALPAAMRARRCLAVPGPLSRRLMIGLPEWQESWARLEPALVPVRVLPDTIDETDLAHTAARTAVLSLGGLAGVFAAQQAPQGGTLLHNLHDGAAAVARSRGLAALRLGVAPPASGPERQAMLAAALHLLSATHGRAVLPPFLVWRDQPGRPVHPDQIFHLLGGGRMALALAPGLCASDMLRAVRREAASMQAVSLATRARWALAALPLPDRWSRALLRAAS